MPAITRRKGLALLGSGAALGLVGGAVAYADADGSPHAIVNNQTDRDQVVTTAIRSPEEGRVLVDDTTTIPANDDRGYANLVADGPLSVTIRTEDGGEGTYRWEETDPRNGLSVGITADRIGFAVATPP